MATVANKAEDHKLLVAGERVETGEWSDVESPYDGTPVGRVPKGDAALVDKAAKAARKAFEEADFPQNERGAVLERASRLAAEREDDLAATIAPRPASRSRPRGSRPSAASTRCCSRRSRPAS